MVVLQAQPVLLIALAVWVPWRALLWYRHRVESGAREVAVAVTFLWSLVIVRVTFFPLTIIFYDWHGASNLVPFASILQLIRDTPTVFAFENIVGNLVLFVPLGVLLPILFEQLRRPTALLWRAAFISLLVEGTQFLTRARSVDIDDVILNATGAMIGLGIYCLAAMVIRRFSIGRRVLGRIESGARREPLLAAAVPLFATAAIAVPMMMSTVVGQTLSNGADGIESVALADLVDAHIVARGEIGAHTLLVASSEASAGPVVRLSEFERVLPGRYTWLATADSQAGTGSMFQYYVTAFNPSVGEQPMLVIWGTNADSAAAVRVTGNGIDSVLTLETGSAFATGVEFAYDSTVGILDEFDFEFIARDGAALPAFRQAGV